MALSALLLMHSYIDDIFFTSNEPLEKINQMLDEVNNLHPNIKLVRQIGTSVSFLDLFIERQLNPTLYHSNLIVLDKFSKMLSMWL
jgi:hypothetical protein